MSNNQILIDLKKLTEGEKTEMKKERQNISEISKHSFGEHTEILLLFWNLKA
jgi:hypothetical protein